MKIEIAESMIYSWLRKVKNCRLVQTNWKPAPEWTPLNLEGLKRLKTASESYFSEVLTKMDDSFISDADSTEFEAGDTLTDTSVESSRIFKKTANLDQLLAQTECDVLGLCLEDGNYKAFAVEVAFHENGLNYSGGRKVTAKKIASKFLRTIIALKAYFGIEAAELIFASPHVKSSTLEQVNQMMDELNAFLAHEGLTGFSVSVLFNEKFRSEIIVPLVQSVEKHGASDGSELFVRALKLISLGEKLPRLSGSTQKRGNTQKDVCKATPDTTDSCGAFVASAPRSRKMEFKNWMIKRNIRPNTANSYISGVNTSSNFAQESLNWGPTDFFSMTNVDEVVEKVAKLLQDPSFRKYSEQSHDSRKCGLERYVEFMKDTQR